MSKHLVLDVVALAEAGKSREEIAIELGVTVESVSRRLRYAKRAGKLATMPPRKKRVARVVTEGTEP
jgi:predicted transcriptional regulator